MTTDNEKAYCEFWDIIDFGLKFKYEDGRIINPYEAFKDDLYFITKNLKREIIENITNLSKVDRDYYLRRLNNRIDTPLQFFVVDNKENMNIIDDSVGIHLTNPDTGQEIISDPDYVKDYFNMLKPYKEEVLKLIRSLLSENPLEESSMHKVNFKLPELENKNESFTFESISSG